MLLTMVNGATIVLYEPAIIAEHGQIVDPRASGWINAYKAVTSPKSFESFEEWRSYLGGSIHESARPEYYETDVSLSRKQSLESIIYAIEHEEDAPYLLLGSINGVRLERAPYQGEYSDLVGTVRTFKWVEDRWVAVHGMDVEPMQRPFSAITSDDIAQLLESGIVTQVARLQRGQALSEITHGEVTRSAAGNGLADQESPRQGDGVTLGVAGSGVSNGIAKSQHPENEVTWAASDSGKSPLAWWLGAAFIAVIAGVGLIRRRMS